MKNEMENEMTDELIKFTTEYIANCRKAKGGPWVFQDTRQALDEIERLRDQLARRDALIERMVREVALFRFRGGVVDVDKLDALIVEGRATKKESVE